MHVHVLLCFAPTLFDDKPFMTSIIVDVLAYFVWIPAMKASPPDILKSADRSFEEHCFTKDKIVDISNNTVPKVSRTRTAIIVPVGSENIHSHIVCKCIL